MSKPTSREQFTQYCMAKLGRPVIKVNVSEEQVQDRIDEAILFWQDYNVDGTYRQLYKYQLQAADFTNQYITLPENIIGAVSIFDVGDIEGTGYLFNVRYQIALNDLYTLTSVSMVPYYMAYSHLQLLEQMLVGKKAIRYNRIANRLHIDSDWGQLSVGGWIIVDAYSVIDSNQFPNFWSDRLLMRYATALIKKQWGTNIGKLGNVPLLNGVTLNGIQIYEQATAELAEIEEKMISEYSAQPEIFFG